MLSARLTLCYKEAVKSHEHYTHKLHQIVASSMLSQRFQ